MLKSRLIGGIVVREGRAVQSIGFQRYLPIGDPAITAEFLNRWGIDEILLMDISATTRGSGPDLDLVRAVARRSFVPVTVAGGIRTVGDVRAVIGAGCDKIALNTAGLADPTLIRRVADRFGVQCVVASIDIAGSAREGYWVYSRNTDTTGLDPFAVATRFVVEGAGELLVTSVERDGSKRGYDTELLQRMAEKVAVPLIAMGGAGHPAHFSEVLAIPGVTAAAAANFFQFTEHSVLITKGFLKRQGIPLRDDTYADYSGCSFDTDGRLAKKLDRDLTRLIYEFYPDEVI